ncbi:MAG: hypothetical protein ACT4PP_05150 [Sporichthyaceae bacterium]
MKTSLASSPLLPAVTGLAALALIFGTLSNADTDSDATPSANSGELPPVDVPDVDVPAAVKAPVKCTATVCTVTFAEPGSVAKVFGTTVTGVILYENGIELGAKKDGIVVDTKKGGKLAGFTVKVTKVSAKGVTVTFTKS